MSGILVYEVMTEGLGRRGDRFVAAFFDRKTARALCDHYRKMWVLDRSYLGAPTRPYSYIKSRRVEL